MCTKKELEEAIENALTRNNIARDKLWEKRMAGFIVQVMEKTDISINKRIEHLKSSPETREELDELKACQEEARKCQKEISSKVNEMHKVFFSSKFTIRIFVWLFSTMGIIAGSLLAVRELFKK